ncbi:MAG TPA: hypothetical protein VLV78_16035 [Thermoanaerobaculia bacterium]|nr:hypothetical protein [Thermoanaerobaculia bacterium]
MAGDRNEHAARRLARSGLTIFYALVGGALLAAYAVTVLLMHYRPQVLAQRVSATLGEPQSPPVDLAYSAAMFSADEGTWTVHQDNVTTMTATKDGQREIVSFFLGDTQVAGEPHRLQILLPGPYSAAAPVRVSILIRERGAQKAGFAQVARGSSRIDLSKSTGERWLPGATDVYGKIVFEIP